MLGWSYLIHFALRAGLEPVAAVNLGMLVRDVAQEVAPLDASPIKRLARVLKDDKAAAAPAAGPVPRSA